MDVAEKHNRRIVIKDLSSGAVSDLLFFYLHRFCIGQHVPRLKEVRELELAMSLGIDNTVDIFVQSEMYTASQLKEAALLWIVRQRFLTTIQTDEFKRLIDYLHSEQPHSTCNLVNVVGELKRKSNSCGRPQTKVLEIFEDSAFCRHNTV